MKQRLKKIYINLPFKKQLFTLIKMCITLPPSLYQHLYFKGFFRVKTANNKPFKLYHPAQIEENEIFWRGLEGGWEKKSMSLWQELCKDASVIFDIGANTGLYSLVAQAVNSQAKILAFEPLPVVMEIFQKNIQANNFPIIALECALSNFKGEASVFLPEHTDFSYSVTVNKSLLDKNTVTKELKIKTETLKNIIEKSELAQIDLMKIDVETHEPEVLEGMGEYLKRFRPTMLIEVLEDACAEKLNILTKDLDYLVFNIDDQNNSYRKVNQIEKSDHWNLLLCQESVARKLNLTL